MRSNKTFVILAASLLLTSACSRESVPAPPSPAASEVLATGFVNKVWRVRTSSTVAPGTLYVFLSEGTLIVTSANSRPSLGTWKFEDGAFTMVEESIPYTVEILELTGNEFRIRSHNPGTPVEITLVPADEPSSDSRESHRGA